MAWKTISCRCILETYVRCPPEFTTEKIITRANQQYTMEKQWLEAQAAFTPVVGKEGQGSVAFVLMAVGRRLLLLDGVGNAC